MKKNLLQLYKELNKFWRLFLPGFLIFTILVSYFAFWRGVPEAEASWWDDGWHYRKQITVNKNYVQGSLQNFPVLVSLTDSDLGSHAQADGDDIAFALDDGTQLDHEIESYSAGVLVAWVKLPDISSSQDKKFFMYYGNASAVNQESVSDVWGSDYKGVWHMAEDPSITTDGDCGGGTAEVCDSTANSNDGDSNGVMTNSDLITGKIGQALDLDGTNDNISFTDDDTLDVGTGDYTISIWFKRYTSATTNLRLFFKGASSDTETGYSAWVSDASISAGLSNGTTRLFATSATHSGVNNWSMYTLVIDRDGNMDSYMNGNYVGSSDISSFNGQNINSAVNFIIGSRASDLYFPGVVDETHLAGVVRSGDWIKTEYNNQNSPSTFLSIGTEEIGGGPVGYWALDEGYGIVAHDESTNGNDGDINGATWKDESECVVGKCLDFDGADDYVSLPNAEFFNIGEQTLGMWIKPNANPPVTRGFIFFHGEGTGDGNRVYILQQTSGVINIIIGSNITRTLLLSEEYVAGEWLYVSLTRDFTNKKLNAWVNGVKKIDDITVVINDPPVHIASQIGNTSESFNGLIDEVKIYNYARSEEEIRQDYNAGLAGVRSSRGLSASLGSASEKWLSDDLVGYWQMDENFWTGAADEILDSSGRDNHGRAYNGATTTPGKFGNGGIFDGTNDYVDISNIDVSMKTISFWLKATTNTEKLMDFDGGTHTLAVTAGVLSASGFNNPTIYIDGIATTSIDTNWHHVLITSDTGFSVSDFDIGRISTDYFEGKVDEVRVYNKKFNSREAQRLYDWAPAPIMHLKMDEKTGGTVNDSSGNVNSGTCPVAPATGGTITYSGGYTIHTFTSSGTFTPSAGMNVEALVVAGGGGGGGSPLAGGGGAGGLLYNASLAVTAQAYTVTVGAGGAGGTGMTTDPWTGVIGSRGSNSVFSSMTAIGGGGGGRYNGVAATSGGSGGGAGYAGAIGTGTAGQGSNGGSATTAAYYGGGGGGGAGGVGGNGTGSVGGVGGIGLSYSISGSATYYAGGGGGSIWIGTPGAGGLGGGGAGGTGNGVNGTANTGGGGGGADRAGTGTAGSGGSGIVIIRYLTPTSSSSSCDWGNGKYGSAVNFNGTSSYVDAGDMDEVDSQSAVTYEAWIYKKGATSYDGIISKYSSTGSSVDLLLGGTLGGTNDLFVRVGNSENSYGYTTDNVIATSTWQHVVMVFDGSKTGNSERLKVFVNGIQKTLTFSGTIPATTASNAASLLIGKYSTNYFNGLIDEVKIYNYARAQKQIIEDMSARGGSAAGGNGAVLNLHFDEGRSGTAYDSSVNQNNGTLYPGTAGTNTSTSSMWTLDGKFGRALEFDGTDDYVDAGNSSSLNITNGITLSAWIKSSTDSNPNNQIINKEGVYRLSLNSNKTAFMLSVDGGWGGMGMMGGNTIITKDQWYHVVGTYDGTVARLYINGNLDNEEYWTGPIATNTSNVLIGTRNTAMWFNGLIDEVKIYPYALNAEEILLDYNQGKSLVMSAVSTASDGVTVSNSANRAYCVPGDTATCNPPVLELKLDEKTGTTAYDTSGNGNDGSFPVTALATGGTITYSGGYTIHTFTSSGTFTPSAGMNVEALVVAGGGGGGQTIGGGGGAGGVVYNSSFAIAGTPITVTVGGGGAGAPAVNTEAGYGNGGGSQGSNSVFSSITAIGGGGGGNYDHLSNGATTGGSGGGIGAGSSAAAMAGTSGQGSAGGRTSACYHNGAGGGGAGAVGGNSIIGVSGGVGGIGVSNSISGSAIYYGGGGGGASRSGYGFGGAGGIGGGGAGGTGGAAGANGTANTGGGGGAGGYDGNVFAGGNGGSGIVIIKYLTPTTAVWTKGRYGSGLEFDGVDDYVSTSFDFSSEIQFTISGWYYREATSNRMDIAQSEDNNQDRIKLIRSTNGLVYGIVQSGSTASYGTFSDNSTGWIHLTMVYDGSGSGNSDKLKMYANGVNKELTFTGTIPATAPTFTNYLNLGYDEGSGTKGTGKLDEVKIYNYARTPAQIAWEYNKGKPIAEWRMDECSGSTIHDESGNGNHGTLTVGLTGTQSALGDCNTSNSASAWYNGRTGYKNASLNFDGTDDYVTIDENMTELNSLQNFTLSSWAKIKSSDTSMGPIITRSKIPNDNTIRINLWPYTDGQIYFFVRNSSNSYGISDVGSYDLNTWHHFVMVFDGTQATNATRLKGYLDGELLNLTYPGDAIPQSSPVLDTSIIGAHGVYYLDGQIDETKIYNYSLTAEQVKMDYNDGAVRFR